MEKILIVSDLSAESELALQRAAFIARTLQAELHVLHVVDNRYQNTLAETIASMAENELKRQLEKHLQPAELSKTQVSIVSGEPYVEILRYSSHLPAAFTVLGMHRKQSFDLYAGTTLDRVTRYNAGISLLARNPEVRTYMNILHPTDFSPEARHALAAAKRLAGDKAKIILAHFPAVSNAPFLSRDENAGNRKAYETECMDRMRRLAEDCLGADYAGRIEFAVDDGRPLDAVARLVKSHQVDLIALGKRNRSALSGVLVGSVSRLILSAPPCDVITARA